MKEKLTVSVPEETIKRAKARADKEKRNLSNMVSVLLEDALDKMDSQEAA